MDMQSITWCRGCVRFIVPAFARVVNFRSDSSLLSLKQGAVLGMILSWSCAGLLAGPSRQGQVQYSNGDSATGALSLTPGSDLKIHTAEGIRTLSLDGVQEMTFAPEKENLEQKWRFVEAGRTQKERWGKPCPVRELRATLTLSGGAVLTGHLYTTVLYLEGAEQTTKVVLRAKDRGGEGQAFADLVYPVRIAFTDAVEARSSGSPLVMVVSNATELVALVPGSLVRLPAVREAHEGEFRLPRTAETNAFLAARTETAITVAWSVVADTRLVARLEPALVVAQDFFDSKVLLGVQRRGDDLYTLLMLSCTRRTTLDAANSQPWRLEVWRWKDNGDTVMLAGRGYFFRGILRPGATPPPVRLVSGIQSAFAGEEARVP